MKWSNFAGILILTLVISAFAIVNEASCENKNHQMRHGYNFGPSPNWAKFQKVNELAAARGKVIFEKNCISCHGESADGKGPVAKFLISKPANLRAIAQEFPNHHFYMMIAEGKDVMPAWKDVLSENEMIDLSHYIRSLK